VARELPLVVDDILLSMVRATNSVAEFPDDEQGVGLVLTVGGVTISGILIPNWIWFKKVEEYVRKRVPVSDDGSNGLAEFFSYFSNELISLREETAKISRVIDELPEIARQAVTESDRTEFIHLDDARVYQPGHPGLPANGMLWRGRLKDISGWSLGLFEPRQ